MIYQWNDIREDEAHLLLGNGFSMSISQDFGYHSLLETFGNGPIGKYSCTKDIFEKLNTSNFEDVLKAIYHAFVVSIDNENALKTLYDDVKSALIKAVHQVHPKYDDIPVVKIRDEIKDYNSIFTTNYDLIIYWTILSGMTGSVVDFFWGNHQPFNKKDAEIFGDRIPIYYLHGAVHLKTDLIGRSMKSSVMLDSVNDFYSDIKFGEFPLFISEGNSDIKRQKIEENSYLRFCYENLMCLDGYLVVFGHALSGEYDKHIIEAIKTSSVKSVAISVFSGLNDTQKMSFVARINEEFDGSNKNILFYESSSHPFGSIKS